MWGWAMSDRSFMLFCALILLATSTAFIYRGHREGRCQSACWLAGYTYTSTAATACLCDGAGGPVAINIPKEPTR